MSTRPPHQERQQPSPNGHHARPAEPDPADDELTVDQIQVEMATAEERDRMQATIARLEARVAQLEATLAAMVRTAANGIESKVDGHADDAAR